MVGSLWPVSGSVEEVIGLLDDWLSQPREPDPLVIETSGSTGSAKRVRLSRRALTASVDATHARLGGPGPWTLLLPPAYVAGVQVIIRSLRAGHRPDLELTGRGYLALVPTQLRRLLATDAAALAAYDAVLVGGAHVDPAIRAAAEQQGVRVIATYGMSETCGGCVYDGRPLAGVSVRIGSDGRVGIKGPILFDGYDDEPADLDDGWFVTDDLGELGPDGRLRILGRADDVVNSGGVKVPAGAVAARLREHPDVVGAEVLGVPDPEWGERVVAFVEARPVPDLRAWVAERMPRAWAPKQVVAVTTWPLLPNGKVDRDALRRLA